MLFADSSPSIEYIRLRFVPQMQISVANSSKISRILLCNITQPSDDSLGLYGERHAPLHRIRLELTDSCSGLSEKRRKVNKRRW
ncbi:hypothetical protein AVEN_219956-1 [Araneus ventricosus]|uniref:Uncharacterized protein n=1 Tax=Araneus ventricosus TaxID=182803 RepID=A0A4Y2TNM1_ARAVE|nr:hypothetical protein AVEN_219956-1 [Araneus ventricosus]